MTPPRHGRRIAVVVAPLAALAVAWTSHQVVLDTTSAVAPTPSAPAAPASDPVSLPEVSDAIEAPASVSGAVRGGSGATGSTSRVAEVAGSSSAAPGDIPAPALAAYQRAESIINAADAGCQISWQLVAAIGSVESDHGRYGGSALDDLGRASPAILGPVLDGGPGMSTIRDTDAGQYDADEAFDRAVGPMQFIPSTWAVAGVDADDDGRRDPQDIDDAALAAAVYLCSGTEDLSTRAGQEAAVHRYNHSDSYVDLVLARAQAYRDGDVVGGGGSYGSVVNAGALTPLTPVSSARVRPALLRGGAAAVAARSYRDVARAYGFGEAVSESADDDLADDEREVTEDAAVAAGATTAAARRGHRPGSTPARTASEPATGAAGDAAPAPQQPTVAPDPETPAATEPAPTGSTPTPPTEPAPAPQPPPTPALTPEQQADATCLDQGLADDPAAVADPYDLCVADQLGLPAPVDPDADLDPSPASTEPDA